MTTDPRWRVAIDASRAFAATATGTETYSSEVIRRLVVAGAFAYRLYRRDPLAEGLPGADVRVLPGWRLWTHTRLGPALARERPDLLFVPAHVLPVWPTVRSVVTVHDLGYLSFPEAHTAFQRWYLDWTTRRHGRRATRLIADSAATRDDLVRCYGIDGGRIDVVPLGVDPLLAPAPAATIDALRQRLGLPPDTRYCLHVGTLQPRKNLTRLVRAFAAATTQRPATVLVLAGGRGWGREDLAAVAHRSGVGSRVVFPGYVARSDLAALYSGAQAVLVPSLYEGFGLTALEAMACDTPVAVSAASSLPEVVGEAALLFDPLDEDDITMTIDRLLRDAALRLALVAAGRERVAGFSWDRCAAATEAVLRRALVGGA